MDHVGFKIIIIKLKNFVLKISAEFGDCKTKINMISFCQNI